MNKALVITRPDHDITTGYLYHWSKHLLRQAEKHKVQIVDLDKKRANRKELESVINKIQPSLIVLNGHGNSNLVTGFDNEVLLAVNDNESLLKNTVTYARSCESAYKLGPASIKSGARAYIGYTDEFVFMLDEAKITKPLEDKTAKLFLEPSNQVAVSLIKGHTAGVAHEKSKDLYRKNIQHLLTSESVHEDKEALPYLLWDMNHQVCLGDVDAQV